jgi:hypothetical protein
MDAAVAATLAGVRMTAAKATTAGEVDRPANLLAERMLP